MVFLHNFITIYCFSPFLLVRYKCDTNQYWIHMNSVRLDLKKRTPCFAYLFV